MKFLNSLYRRVRGAMLLLWLALAGCSVSTGGIECPYNINNDPVPVPVITVVRAETISSIRIDWSLVPEAASYFVYRSASEDGADSRIAIVHDTYYIDRSINANTVYYYKVSAAKDNIGEGGKSEPVSGMAALPAKPEKLQTSVQSASGITLSWAAASYAGSYEVMRLTGGVWTQITTVTTTSYTDSGLSSGTEYSYKVIAVNPLGKTESAVVSVRIQAPDIPAGFAVQSKTDNSITLTWNITDGASKYEIWKAAVAGGETYYTELSGNTYTDTGLVSGVTYYYKVLAVNIIGKSALSAEIPVSPLLPAPSGLTGAVLNRESIKLDWNIVSGAQNYKVYTSTDDKDYTFVTAGSNTYTCSGLSVDIDYYFKVSAVSSVEEGMTGESVSLKISTPPAPETLSAGALSATEMSLTWSRVSGAASYTVYRSMSKTGTYSNIGTAETNSFTDTGLSLNSTYWYKVSSVNIIGEGTQSEPFEGTISAPPAPTGVKVTPLSWNSVRIDWNTVPGALTYSISGTVTTSTSLTTYTVTGLKSAQSCSFQIAVVNAIGTGTKSASVTTYTMPYPLEDSVWYTYDSSTRSQHYSYSSGYYEYYSFPVSGGTYKIQWANEAKTGDAGSVSAYWSGSNSMENLTTSYFTSQYSGFANPPSINAPSSGYIIVKVSSGNYYSIRFWKE